MNLGDDQLAQQAAGGDPQAFTALFDRYYPQLCSYFRYRCLEPEAAEDLAESVFERLLTALPRFNPGRAPFSAWLFGIARHALIDWQRRRRFTTFLPWEVFSRHPAPTPSPEEAAVESEFSRELSVALAQLSERERDIVALKFSARLNNRQISQVTGWGENQVAVILYRALRRLRQKMNPFNGWDVAKPAEVSNE